MTISIECSNCHQQYKVDDKVAGKKVKCKGCGALITVPAANVLESLEVLGPEEEKPIVRGPSAFTGAFPGATGGAPKPPPAPVGPPTCPACSTPLAPGARICLRCGLNLQNVRGDPGPEIELADTSKIPKKRWVRQRGSAALESVDEIIKLVMTILLFVGIIVWIVHVYKTPAGLSAGTLAPLFVVLGLFAGVLVPLTSVSISTIVKILNYVPRGDSYIRVLFSLMFPFIISLVVGWPGAEGKWDGLVVLAWIIAPGMLIYLFRAEPVEWGASVATAAVAILIGILLMSGVASVVTMATGPLYADMLPHGPWQSVAKGNSADAIPATKPAVAAGPAVPEQVPTPSVTPVTPPPTTPAPVTPPSMPTQVVETPKPVVPPPAPKVDPPQPAPVEAALKTEIKSPLLTDATADDPQLQDVSDVVIPSNAAGYFLVVKHPEDSQETKVERWSVNPLEKKDVVTFPQVQKRLNAYMLSTKGDVLVALVTFPRYQLEICRFDGKTPKKIVPLDVEADAAFSMLGFLDMNRFSVRWDFKNDTVVQIFSVGSGGQEVRRFSTRGGGTPNVVQMTAIIKPVAYEPNSILLSPDGHSLAVLGRDRVINIYSTDSGRSVHQITPTNVDFKMLQLCFSKDSSQIAMYGLVSDMPTVLSFKTLNGDPIVSAVLPTKSLLGAMGDDAHALAAPAQGRRGMRGGAAPSTGENVRIAHDLIWVQEAQAWLANGNEFIDAVSGDQFATLGLQGRFDAQYIEPGHMFFVIHDPNVPGSAVFAKLDLAQIRSTTKAK